jgi:hypothetical protein
VGITHHSDDLASHRRGIVADLIELPAEEVLAMKELVHESLIHDHQCGIAIWRSPKAARWVFAVQYRTLLVLQGGQRIGFSGSEGGRQHCGSGH